MTQSDLREYRQAKVSMFMKKINFSVVGCGHDAAKSRENNCIEKVSQEARRADKGISIKPTTKQLQRWQKALALMSALEMYSAVNRLQSKRAAIGLAINVH